MAPRRGTQEADYGEDDDRIDDVGDDERVQGRPGDEGPEGEIDEESEDASGLTGEEQEADGSEDLDDEPEQPPRETRATRRFRELNERLARSEQELQELRRQGQQPARPQLPRDETDAEFEERIALFEPEQRMEARFQRSNRQQEQRIQLLQVSNADQLDKANYNSRAVSDKRYSKYADEVERRHQLLLQGHNGSPPQLVPRETILRVIIGERVLGADDRQVRRQQQRSQQRVARQTVRAPNNRGDAGTGRPERRGSGDTERDARRRRIENIEI